MVNLEKHALVCSHISSAFNQPTFYGVPPSSSQKARHPIQGSTHASKKLLDKINGTQASGASSNANTEHAGTSLLPSFEEHAVQASLTSLNHLGDVLLRVTHSGYVVELTLLDWVDGRPVCWEFKERVVPMPTVFVPAVSSAADSIAFVFVLLEGGSLYRLGFPLIAPFFHDENWISRRMWFNEYTLPSSVSRPIGGETGTMVSQGERNIVVAVNNGALLRIEVEAMQFKEKLHYPQHSSLLSKMFRTTNPEEDAVISLVHAPAGENLDRHIGDWVFTLSRDRSLRGWDKQSGNAITVSVPPAPGTIDYANNASVDRTVRGSSVSVRGGSVPPSGSPATSHTPQLLPAERRTLLRTFYTDLDPNLRVLVFMPIQTILHTAISGASLSAGFFILYKAQGNTLVPIGEKMASERTARCTLRDFVIMDSDEMQEIHCLWERSGESLYEMTELDIEVQRSHRSQSTDDDIQMGDRSGSDWDEDLLPDAPWHLIKFLNTSNTSSSASNIDFLSTLDLTSPTVTSTILNALFRPGGGFSPYTIEEALRGYIHAAWVPQDGKHFDPLSDPNARLRAALKKQYPTLRARVGAIVGCRLGDFQSLPTPVSAGKLGASHGPGGNPFGATVIGEDIDGAGIMQLQQQQNEYFAALRRDWEGFLARCREIEKAGRWPVALGVAGIKNIRRMSTDSRTSTALPQCVVLERERLGMLVKEDDPLGVYNRVQRETDEDQESEEALPGFRRKRDTTYSIVSLALSVKAMFSPPTWAEVMNELYVSIRANVSITYQDLLLDLGRRVDIGEMDDSTVAWVMERLDGIMAEGEEELEDEFIKALDGVSALVRAAGSIEEIVKIEEDEEEVGAMLLHPTNPSVSTTGINPATGPAPDYHNPWTRSLTASYLSSTLEARHDISSSMIFLLMLLKSRGHEWMGTVSAIVLDELFAGLRSTCILRGTAGRVMDGDSLRETATNGHSRTASRGNVLAVVRAGTADSVAARMAGMHMRAGISHGEMMPPPPPRPHVHFASASSISATAAMPPLPPITRGSGSVPLLQNILNPLRRPFSLPYASDAWLSSNGIIITDSMLIASPDEVRFAEALRRRGEQTQKGGTGVSIGGGAACLDAAAEVVDWLPKANAVCYVAGRLRTMKGDYDEAADLFERSGRSFGPLAFRSDTEAKALQAVLPAHLENLGSLSMYYQHIAQLFEEDSQFQYAVPFNKLAIEALEHDGDMDIPGRKDNLWYHVFRGQIISEQWEGAYTTAAEMPPSEQRRKLLSELVTTMCERNKVELFMSFNFLGFSKEVEHALDLKARTADPLERPLYSHICYAWFVKRGDYRKAATIMYHRARTLEMQDKQTMDERYDLMALQLEAYAHAIHALCLLDPRDAWIAVPAGTDRNPERENDSFGEVYLPGSQFGNRDSEIVELEDMRRECELWRARRELLFRLMAFGRKLTEEDFELSPMEIIRRYCEVGFYEEALFSASIFQIDMTIVFTSMVDMCIRISEGGPGALTADERGWLEYEIMALWEGTTVQKAWRLLQHSLERHDSASTGWQYRKTCLERIMDTNRTSSPPTWLTAFLQDREPEYLIRTCLRYHMVLPAIDYTLSMIQKANLPFDQGAVVGVTQTHLPYGLIDSVVAAAQSNEEKRRVGLIKAEIAARVGKVGRWDWS